MIALDELRTEIDSAVLVISDVSPLGQAGRKSFAVSSASQRLPSIKSNRIVVLK